MLYYAIPLVLSLLTAGCDGTYALFLKRPAAATMSCDEMAVRLEERNANGKFRVRVGMVRLLPGTPYIAIQQWASGGAPVAFRVTMSCSSTQRVAYDSG